MKMLPPHRHRSSLEEPLRLSNLPGTTEWSGKIAYLDRDGVLNRWREGYVNSANELELLAGAGNAVGLLRRNGFRVCIVTNQSPVGRGIWGHDALSLIHDSLQEQLLNEDEDAEIDLILYSPYPPDQGAWARKPRPGMLEAGRQLIDNSQINPDQPIPISYGKNWHNRPSEKGSILVGDRESDILAAETFGVRGIQCNPETGIAGVIDMIIPPDLEGQN
jgi:HAD-superfamily hydrolase, subfamily IIIA